MKLFPSLISSDLLKLEDTIHALEPYVDGFHLDVMDFHYVPNLTWGPAFMNAIRKATKKQLWVHLMVDNPQAYLERLELAPGDILSFHPEILNTATTLDLCKQIAARALVPSIALKPTTPITTVEPLFAPGNSVKPGQVLVMSVEPGFSGQKFLTASIERLHELVQMRTELNAAFSIGIDGGISQENIGAVCAGGAQEIAAAAAIFATPDPIKAIKLLHQKAGAL